MALIDYSARRYDIRFTKGDDIVETLKFYDLEGEPMDLDGYTFVSQVRDGFGELVAEFDIEVEDNAVTRILTNDLSSTVPDGSYQDLQSTDPGGYVRTWISGKMIPTSEYSF